MVTESRRKWEIKLMGFAAEVALVFEQGTVSYCLRESLCLLMDTGKSEGHISREAVEELYSSALCVCCVDLSGALGRGWKRRYLKKSAACRWI